MKRLLPSLTTLAHIMLLLLAGFTLAQAAKPNNPVVVTSLAKESSVVDEVQLSGTVSSPRVARLSTEVSGLVKNIRVEAGSQVKAGDILLTMQTELESLSLQAAQATARRAAEELSDAKRRLEDGKRLAKKKTLSASELKSLQAEVNIASASLQRYTAEMHLQQAKIKRHQLIAPFSGVISQKFVEVGEWLQPGDAVARLVANENLRIDFQVPQRVYPRIKISAAIQVKLDALPGQTLKGIIQTIVPFSDSEARTFLLRVSLPESTAAIAPGMSASGLLQLETGSMDIVVPRDAILRYPDGRITVWIVHNKQGQLVVSEQQVKTGLSFNGKVSILDGLSAGDQIVVEGNEALKDGQTVTLHKQ